MRLITILLVVYCFACRSTVAQSNPEGEYAAKGKDYEVYLNLKSDSSFIYREKNLEVSSEAKGKWKYSLADTIYLVRDSVALPEMLSSGYMKNIPTKVIVENKNEVKVGTTLLKRKS